MTAKMGIWMGILALAMSFAVAPEDILGLFKELIGIFGGE